MYADAEYYTGDFAGTAIPSESQAKALMLASDLIDGATHYRIGSEFEDLSAFRKSSIQRACCYLAEDLYAGGLMEPGTMLAGGFSLGDLSIQAPSHQSRLGGVPVREIVQILLRSTGLLYPGVR